jgi:Family of unknown function (DUF6152)
MGRSAAVRVFVAGASCVLAAFPVLAHHSLAAKYDVGQLIMLQGTVTKLDWSNPHARLYLDIKDAGAVQMWDFEMASPNLLMINGWKIDSFRKGDRVVVSAYPSRDGSHSAFATKVALASH